MLNDRDDGRLEGVEEEEVPEVQGMDEDGFLITG